MKAIRVIFISILIMMIALLVVSCDGTSNDRERTNIEEQQTVYLDNQPIPKFDFSLERDAYIQLYEARNEAVNTYTVIWSQIGVHMWECPSIGYPIPGDTKLVNPLQVDGSYVVEQAEPNGLYSSKNSAATWVLCVDDDSGEVYPVYTEFNAT